MSRIWNMSSDSVIYEGWRHQADSYFINWRDELRHNLQMFFGDSINEIDIFRAGVSGTLSVDDVAELTQAVNIFVSDTFKFEIEYSRVRKWRKTGVLWWSLIDMWPMMFNYTLSMARFRT